MIDRFFGAAGHDRPCSHQPTVVPPSREHDGSSFVTARVNPSQRRRGCSRAGRAGLVTRGAAAAVDIGVVAVTLVVGYLAFCVLVFLLPPEGFEAPVPPSGWTSR